tara:strand:+ start:183 stop:347 length:165 start_codon:yes stop_codon:yes gene_type:complete
MDIGARLLVTPDKIVVDEFEIVDITASMNNDDVYVHLRDKWGYEYKGEITGVME